MPSESVYVAGGLQILGSGIVTKPEDEIMAGNVLSIRKWPISAAISFGVSGKAGGRAGESLVDARRDGMTVQIVASGTGLVRTAPATGYEQC